MIEKLDLTREKTELKVLMKAQQDLIMNCDMFILGEKGNRNDSVNTVEEI